MYCIVYMYIHLSILVKIRKLFLPIWSLSRIADRKFMANCRLLYTSEIWGPLCHFSPDDTVFQINRTFMPNVSNNIYHKTFNLILKLGTYPSLLSCSCGFLIPRSVNVEITINWVVLSVLSNHCPKDFQHVMPLSLHLPIIWWHTHIWPPDSTVRYWLCQQCTLSEAVSGIWLART